MRSVGGGDVLPNTAAATMAMLVSLINVGLDVQEKYPVELGREARRMPSV